MAYAGTFHSFRRCTIAVPRSGLEVSDESKHPPGVRFRDVEMVEMSRTPDPSE